MEINTDFHIENFDGPLDLLLNLVKDKKMDIFAINLIELASAYLELIIDIKDANLDLASEYLVMASSLIQMKAKMLLADPNTEGEVDEEKSDLLSRLVEYHQFKKVAEKLKENEKSRKDLYIKETSDYNEYQDKPDEAILDGNSNAVKLISVMRKMFERTNAEKLKHVTIEKFNLSPADRRIEIIKLFKEKKDVTFNDIFNVPTMNHFVVTMLTVLDMSRKQELVLIQDEQYSTITIEKGEIDE